MFVLIELATPSEAKIRALRCMDYATGYLHSDWWRERRELQLQFAGRRCQICYSGIGLEVHHRCYDNLGCEPMGDLVLLCGDCHALFSGRTKIEPESLPVAEPESVDEGLNALYASGDEEGVVRLLRERHEASLARHAAAKAIVEGDKPAEVVRSLSKMRAQVPAGRRP